MQALFVTGYEMLVEHAGGGPRAFWEHTHVAETLRVVNSLQHAGQGSRPSSTSDIPVMEQSKHSMQRGFCELKVTWQA